MRISPTIGREPIMEPPTVPRPLDTLRSLRILASAIPKGESRSAQ